MAYDTTEARQELLDSVAETADRIADAIASLGAAYEQLDDHSADRLEEELFRPVQVAYGRAKRTHAEFAARHRLPARTLTPATPPAGGRGVRELLERAVDAVADADDALAELQDSMRPVEVGDPALRAGLAEVRDLLGGIRASAREFVRVLGR